ncbi:MAG: YigZ family protein [Acidobacteria bacterium]|nr:YigZ family protein [Acidobacteriota bacterium]
MSEREFLTISRSAEVSTNIKGSIFISRCERVSSIDEAMNYIKSIRAKHLDATHNCWAYRISPSEYRFNDDGEPSGTAGQPMFQALLGANLEEVCIVVTRYYGGTKLGAGGLARAYGGGASAVLKEAETLLVKPKVTFLVEAPFSEQNSLFHFLQTHKELTTSVDYTNTGIQVEVSLYLSDRDKIIESLTNSLRGRVQIIE